MSAVPNDLQRLRAATHAPAASAPPPDGVVLLAGDAIRPQAIDWLWPGWLAAGKLHVNAGQPGTGKTTIALALAAVLTKAGRWPDGSACRRAGNVIVWSGEDDPSDTLAPRLLAAGADMGRIRFVQGTRTDGEVGAFDPASDMPLLLEAAMRWGDVRLLIVDPIVSAVAGDSHKGAEVRRGLQPLVDLGAKLGCAVLGISHFSKGTGGREVTERVTGSIAFGALARIVLATAKRSEAEGGGRLLARAKSNIGADDGGIGYELEQVELADCPGVFASRVVWGEALEGSARELLAAAETQADDDDAAGVDGFLRSLLADGSVPAKLVKADAEGAGYVWRTVHRAADRLGIERRKEGMRGGWVWALPTASPGAKMPRAPAEDAEGDTLQSASSSASSVRSLASSDDGEVL